LVTDREPEIRGYTFGEVDLDIGLLRVVRPGWAEADLRQRDFIGDERIIGQDRRREKPFAGKTVSKSV